MKNEYIQIGLAPKHKAKLKREAKVKGVSLSTHVRLVLEQIYNGKGK